VVCGGQKLSVRTSSQHASDSWSDCDKIEEETKTAGKVTVARPLKRGQSGRWVFQRNQLFNIDLTGERGRASNGVRL